MTSRGRLKHNARMAAADDSPCLFCDIVAGRLESSRVHEDAHVVAFMDIQPVTPGHLLVIPRAHADSLEVLDEDLGTRIFGVAHRLARALRRSGLPCDGVNMFLADGEAAFQEVSMCTCMCSREPRATVSASTLTGVCGTATNSTPQQSASAAA